MYQNKNSFKQDLIAFYLWKLTNWQRPKAKEQKMVFLSKQNKIATGVTKFLNNKGGFKTKLEKDKG